MGWRLLVVFLGLLALAGCATYEDSGSVTFEDDAFDAPQVDSEPPPGYVVKGNISVSSGEKLYHVPGMRDYDITVIDVTRGERWFKTEEEAIAAGWRRAVKE
jgi:hypothetical protein